MNKLSWLLLLITISTLKAQETKIEVFNTSINSVYAELGVSYLDKNTVLFASSKKVDEDKNFSRKRRQNNSQLHLELYLGSITNQGDIIQTIKFSTHKNNPVLESDISFSPDKKTVYFTWNNYYSTQTKRDSAKWKTLHIVKGTINENLEISNIIPVPFNSKKYSVRNPEVSKDGKQLFFVSDMSDSYGDFDIYVVDILPNNTYSTPKNLGPNVNTKETELFPFVDVNNNLYFSSLGHSSQDRFNIFKSELINGVYQKSKALKAPINSTFDDFAYVENETGKAGFFTSNRKESKGDVDIFAFKQYEKECLSDLIVTVFNKENQLELANVSVDIFENNTFIKNVVIDPESPKISSLKCNTSYKISAELNGFHANEIVFETPKTTESLTKTIFLQPLNCIQTISGIVNNSTTKQTIPNTTVALYENNQLISSQLVNEDGYHFKINCNTSYKLIANNNGYETTVINFSSDNNFNKNTTLPINLAPIQCKQSISGIVLNKENGEPIMNSTVSLYTNNTLIETEVTNTNEFNFIINCETAYIIQVEKDQFTTAKENLVSDTTFDKNNPVTIYLTPVKCEQSIAGIVINTETNEPIINAKVSLYSNNEFLETQFTTPEKGYHFNVDCNANYKIIASYKGFTNAEHTFKTSLTNNQATTKNINLDPIIEFITLGEKQAIKTNAIYFDLDSHEIRPDAAIELNKVVGVLKSYPTIKIEVQSHTDSRAPDNYNLALSHKRANASMNYIISQGIDSNRLIGKGYGETKLTNKCANGVPCSNAEHEANRRTEFVIIEKEE